TGVLAYNYVCNYCQVLFTDISDILDHIEDHFVDVPMPIKEERSFNSEIREDVLKSCDDFTTNYHTTGEADFIDVKGDVTLKCKPCDDVCIQVEKEESKRRRRYVYPCDNCKSRFKSQHQLSLHIKQEHNADHIVEKKGVKGIYKCDHCNQNINGKLLFYAHQYEHLAGANKCDSMTNVSLLDRLKAFLDASISFDENSPEKAYGCKICSHCSLKVRRNIERHILQTHVCKLKDNRKSEKKFSCEYCGHKFKLSHNLMVHKRRHTMEKPYKCQICNKSFSHASYMKYHEAVHRDLYTHQCSTCGLSFRSKPKLNTHMKCHSSEMFTCPVCSKEFRSHRINRHIKHVHQNVTRPYKCDVCAQAFKTSKTLKTHSFRHTGEKRYACRFNCSERFISTAGRRGHEKSKHEALA
ncbi:Zinc finger protein, partial [Pseudolycoriella hygida]